MCRCISPTFRHICSFQNNKEILTVYIYSLNMHFAVIFKNAICYVYETFYKTKITFIVFFTCFSDIRVIFLMDEILED